MKMAQLKLTIEILNRICRVCLSTINKMKKVKKDEEIMQILTEWIPLTIDLLDILPKKLCVVCISKLNMLQNFVQTCARAQIELKQAIENDKHILLPYLKSLQEQESSSEDESDEDEDADTDDSDSIALSLPDDLFECEEHKLKFEEFLPKTEEDCPQIQIANVESIPEEAMEDECCESGEPAISDDISGFKGFSQEEITLTQQNLDKYSGCIQESICSPKRFFDSVEHKCYLCEKHLNLKCGKTDMQALEFSTLNDDAHVLCGKRIKVLRRIIKDLYVKLDELSSLNRAWQKIFLERVERKAEKRSASNPTKPVVENPSMKPHEIGYRNDGQVHLGHLTWIPEPDFDRAFRYSLSPNKFLVNMALTLFGAETLAKSTITGSSKHGIKKEPLNSIRMCALKSSLKYYMCEYNVPDYYQKYIWKNFNKILGQKISKIASEYKKRLPGNGTSGIDGKRAKK